ncbi:MAG: prepilin-type N-terminal cleavage/methylation domain-containing protein [Candidatus Omnitrophica bacterium]|nr:prepilin-type N-terminal cleavage/methylation domain-containing protein [Candidatus Omnitrophota bacterium]
MRCSNKDSGFTLMEILVVLIIIGILAAMAVPSFTSSFENARSQDAKNNLLSIYAAQLNYFNNNQVYCNKAALSDINNCLSLNIIANGVDFDCSGGTTTSYICTATSHSSGGTSNFMYTLTPAPIVLTSTDPGTNPVCNGGKYCQ